MPQMIKSITSVAPAKILKRLIAIVRREGAVGLYDRWRYPKPFWSSTNPAHPLKGAVLIIGGREGDREQVRAALETANIDSIACRSEEHAACINIDPDLEGAVEMSINDIVVVRSPTCRNFSSLLSAARKCRALLCDSPAVIEDLIDSGVPLERLFFIKSPYDIREAVVRYLIASESMQIMPRGWNEFSDLRGLSADPRICLSLPETFERRRNFVISGPKGFKIFDGIRSAPGWVGAARSFRLMAQACLDQGVTSATLCEDDVQISMNFESRLSSVQEYLQCEKWDVFSGLLTDIGPQYRITKVSQFGGETFVHLNRCVGMVFGIYGEKALTRLSLWSEESSLTIDRYLEESDDLEVVTTVPFLVSHSDALVSSVWGFNNKRYRNMIMNSEARLQAMVEEYYLDSI